MIPPTICQRPINNSRTPFGCSAARATGSADLTLGGGSGALTCGLFNCSPLAIAGGGTTGSDGSGGGTSDTGNSGGGTAGAFSGTGSTVSLAWTVSISGKADDLE